jgi:hypothetical protein
MLDRRNVLLGGEESVPSDAFEALSPSALTAFDLEKDEFNIDCGFYAGQAGSFEDVVTFWNLRAANVDVFFFDVRHEKGLCSFRDPFTEVIRRRPRGLRDFHSFVGFWPREDGPAIDTTAFGHAISGGTVRDGIPKLRVPLIQVKSRHVLGHVNEANGGSQITFQLPERPFRDDDVSFTQMMVVVIHLTLGLQSEFGRTLITQCLPEMNDFYRREMVLSGDQVGVQRRAGSMPLPQPILPIFRFMRFTPRM